MLLTGEGKTWVVVSREGLQSPKPRRSPRHKFVTQAQLRAPFYESEYKCACQAERSFYKVCRLETHERLKVVWTEVFCRSHFVNTDGENPMNLPQKLPPTLLQTLYQNLSKS